MFAKHSREYMVRHGQWEVCTNTHKQLVLLSQLLADLQGKDLLGVPVTQPMVELLCAIFDRTDDLKGSMANQVVRMWPSHFEQFGKFRTRSTSLPRIKHCMSQLRTRSCKARQPLKMAQSQRPTLSW